jgi:hypothetical protein
MNSVRFLSSTTRESDATVIRGTADKTVLIVDDPKTRSQELMNGLGAIGAEADVQAADPAGRIVISVSRSDAVLDYLMDQRILPSGTGPQIVLVLEQTKN